MHRAKNQVACKRRADRDVGGFKIADLADHDHIRILPHDVTQSRGERQTDLRIDMDLIDAVHLVLDRIFNGDDLAIRDIDAL